MLRSRLPWLTFDCYDTLVRYSESKAEALAAVVRAKGGDDVTVDAVQATFEARERSIQTGPFTSLADVLKQSLRDALDAASLPQAPEDDETMLAAVRGAVPFPDVPAVLAELLDKEFNIELVHHQKKHVLEAAQLLMAASPKIQRLHLALTYLEVLVADKGARSDHKARQ